MYIYFYLEPQYILGLRNSLCECSTHIIYRTSMAHVYTCRYVHNTFSMYMYDDTAHELEHGLQILLKHKKE